MNNIEMIEEEMNGITWLVWEGWNSTNDFFLRTESLKNLELETFSQATLEFILLYLHLFYRHVYLLVGSNKRDIIINGVLNNVFSMLEKYDELMLVKIFGENKKSNLEKYFQYYTRISISISLREVFNERQSEYSAYDEIIASPDKKRENTLVWKFSENISNIVKSGSDALQVVRIYMFTANTITFQLNAMKQVLGIM